MRERHLAANGVTLRLVEAGEGPLVLLCHGFPETSHSWRHQLAALAAAGYHAVAPDMRGYGGSDRPAEIAAYTIFDLVGDMVGLLDALAAETAVIVGHDWGAAVAWNAALMRPDRFRAVAGMSVPYAPRGSTNRLAAMRQAGARLYMLYFQEPGRAEREFERDVAATLHRFFWAASGAAPAEQRWRPMLGEGGGFFDAAAAPPGPLGWLTAADFATFVATFERTGFAGGLNWYRNLDRNWQLLAPFKHAVIRQPALFIGGGRDAVLDVPGMRETLARQDRVLSDLRALVMIPEAGHWLQQERPAEVNAALLRFLAGLGQPGAAPPRRTP